MLKQHVGTAIGLTAILSWLVGIITGSGSVAASDGLGLVGVFVIGLVMIVMIGLAVYQICMKELGLDGYVEREQSQGGGSSKGY